MGKAVKQKLLDLLNNTYPSLYNKFVDFDLETVLHQDSGWRGREILSHMGAWNHEVVKTLKGILDKEEYLIPDYDEDEFNHKQVEEQKNLTTASIFENWKHSVKEMILAVENISDDSFPGDFLYPWGDERGDIFGFVKYFIDHDIEHIEEIEKLGKGLK